ncbi:MAG: ABC transporter substrate-binding protein [Eubacteriales bacterium]|nr:ABC transporter substrate-binding protein [Eubacteriales bacterium]
MQKKTAILLTLVMALAMFTAIADGLTVKDFEGREIKLSKPAERIVVLMPADCEILYAIGAGDKIVGRGEYCNYPAEVLEIETVKSGQEMNLEQVLALKPDLVIATKMAHSKENIEALEKAGVPSLVVDAQNIEDVYKVIELIGKVVGMENNAQELIAEMQKGFEEVITKVDGKKLGKVYYEVSPLQWGLWAAGGGTFMDEIGNMLGLENIFAKEAAWAQVSEEQVIKLNPDYIVTTTMYFGEGPKPAEEILSRKGWEGITAVKNEDVYNADNDMITRPGPRLVDAVRDFYEFLYENEAADKAA